MTARLALLSSTCLAATVLAAGCGGGDDPSTPSAAAPAAGVPTTPAQDAPGAPSISGLLAQVPDSSAARRRLAAADVARARGLRGASPVYARAVEAVLAPADARVVAAAGEGASLVVRTPRSLVVAGDGVEARTPEVVPMAGGRRVAAGAGRLVVGRASAELLAGRPRTPVISLRELALAQLCTGDAVAELVLGPREPGFGGDAAGGVAVVPRQGVEDDPEVVVCSVPGNGVPFAGIAGPLRRGLQAAGLQRVGAIEETEDDATERVVLTARVRPTGRALALLGDPARLARVVRGR